MDKNEKTPDLEEKPVKNNKNTEETEEATEEGGPKGQEPTRYGDWERDGRCVDF